MFGKLFGGDKKKEVEKPKPDALATITMLDEQCQNIDKRLKVIENK